MVAGYLSLPTNYLRMPPSVPCCFVLRRFRSGRIVALVAGRRRSWWLFMQEGERPRHWEKGRSAHAQKRAKKPRLPVRYPGCWMIGLVSLGTTLRESLSGRWSCTEARYGATRDACKTQEVIDLSNY